MRATRAPSEPAADQERERQREEEEEEEEEEEGLFRADAVDEEDPERDRATQVRVEDLFREEEEVLLTAYTK